MRLELKLVPGLYGIDSARLRVHRPYVSVPLTIGHRQARLNWVTAHRRWTRRRWIKVLFNGSL